MVDVELVSDSSTDGPDAGSGVRPLTTPGRGRRSLTAAVVLVAAGIVLLGSLRTETDAERRDDALVAAYADVPGIAPSLRDPPAEPWRLTGAGELVGGLVIAEEDVGGTRRTVARDVLTGELRWVVAESVEPAGRGADCSAAVADGAMLLCHVPGEPGQGGPNTDAVLGGTADRLVVLRAEDGQVVTERELGPTTIGWAVLDDDVVIASRYGPTAYVERSTVLDQRSLWRTEMPLPPDVLARQMALTADDGLVALTGSVAGVLDGRTGRLLGTWTASGDGRLPVQVDLSSIGFTVWTAPAEGVWLDRTGAAGARLPGGPVVTAVDDGSVPRVVLLQDAQVLRAVDVYEGVLWERPRGDRVPIRLDGLVVLEESGVLRVVDVVSGRDRWSVTTGIRSPATTRVVTDGVRVLVAGYGASTGRLVTAYGLRDGEPAWTASLPQQG